LVLQIEGDDKKNSLQRDLVSTLNTELSKEAPGQKIEVRAYDETVTEEMGLPQAHIKARGIGKDSEAILVIWGNRIGEKKFHARITIVEGQPRKVMAGERSLAPQNINEMSLPPEIVKQPIYLTHFAAGYVFYDRKDYTSALLHFNAVLNRLTTNVIESHGIHFYIGTTYCYLAQGQKKMAWHLQHAISHFDTVLDYYTEENFPEQWAATQNNLGGAYALLPTGNRSQNLQKAIIAFESSLRVRTEKDFPILWALTQNNLGAAYWHLSLLTSDGDDNLKRAIAAFEASLRVRTERDFPVDWATTQYNLGILYKNLLVGDRSSSLRQSIACFENVLRIWTADIFPHDHQKAIQKLKDVQSQLQNLAKK